MLAMLVGIPTIIGLVAGQFVIGWSLLDAYDISLKILWMLGCLAEGWLLFIKGLGPLYEWAVDRDATDACNRRRSLTPRR